MLALWGRLGPPYNRNKCAELSAIIAVPVLLIIIDALTRLYHSRETEFLLVPPLAVIIYLIFLRPDASYINFRSIVVTPVIGAAVGEVCYHYLGLTPWGIGIATLVVLIAQEIMHSYMPPALALSVLAMLFKAQGVGYTAGVAIATLLVWGAFAIWRRFAWEPLPPAHESSPDLSLERNDQLSMGQ